MRHIPTALSATCRPDRRPRLPVIADGSLHPGRRVLLHDLGMALASYPAGMADLEKDAGWQDAAVQLFGERMAAPRHQRKWDRSIWRSGRERPAVAASSRHAQQAEKLATMSISTGIATKAIA